MCPTPARNGGNGNGSVCGASVSKQPPRLGALEENHATLFQLFAMAADRTVGHEQPTNGGGTWTLLLQGGSADGKVVRTGLQCHEERGVFLGHYGKRHETKNVVGPIPKVCMLPLLLSLFVAAVVVTSGDMLSGRIFVVLILAPRLAPTHYNPTQTHTPTIFPHTHCPGLFLHVFLRNVF